MSKRTKYAIILVMTAALALGSLTASAGIYDAYKVVFGEARWQTKYNNLVDALGSSLTSLSNLIIGWAPVANQDILLPVMATYSSGTTFTVPDDYTAQFVALAKVRVDLGSGTLKGSYVASSSYGGGFTTVILHDSILTNPISGVWVTAARNGLFPYGNGEVNGLDYALGTPSQAGLQTAIDAIGATNRTLLVPSGTWPITDNLTIPTNITLKLERGAILTIATTKTLTINGSLEAGLYQIFGCTGTGKVVFPVGSTVYPEWWGAVGDWNGATGTEDTVALQAALNAGATGTNQIIVRTDKKHLTGELILPSNIEITGTGLLRLKNNGTPKSALYATTKTNIKISGIEIDGNKANNSGFSCGIRLDNVTNCIIDKTYVHDCYGHGINVLCQTGNSYRNKINLNRVEGCTENGITLDTFDSQVIGNTAKGNLSANFNLEGTILNMTDTILQGNIADGAGVSNYGFKLSTGCSGVILTGNAAFSHLYHGFDLTCTNAPVKPLTRITLTNNNSYGNALSGFNITGSNDTTYRVTNSIISGNRAWLNNLLGFYIVNVGDSIIKGNMADSNNQAGGTDFTGSNIAIVNTNDGNNIIEGNIARKGAETNKAYYGFYVRSSGNMIINNDFTDGGSSANMAFYGTPVNVMKGNKGWITNKSGTGTVNSGATYATITHGLAITPLAENISIVGKESPTNAIGVPWVSNIGTTTFRVNIADPGASNWDFGWRVCD